MRRSSLLRTWDESQEQHPLIVAPIYTNIPFEVGKDLTTPEVCRAGPRNELIGTRNR
jgi:hypothetical protein